MQRFVRLLLAALLALGLLACARPAAPEPADTPAVPTATQPPPTPTTPPPTPTPTPAAQPSAEEEDEDALSFQQMARLEQFDSYRLVNTFAWEQGDDVGSMEILSEIVRNPPAQRLVIHTQSADGDAEVTEWIRIGDATYTRWGDEWIAMQISSDQFLGELGWLGGPEELLGASRGRYVGTERINGMEARRYRYDTADFRSAAFAEIKEAYADVWVSTRYNVYIQVAMHIRAVDANDVEGTYDMEITLTDINEPITIEPPPGVAAPIVPDDIPLIEGATNLNVFSGVAAYEVQRPFDEVVAYYEKEMQALDWELAESMAPGILSFSKGERSANVMITENDGRVSVTIIFTEE